MITSELDPEPEIPWSRTFHLRRGVDALTGVPKLSALKGPTVPLKSAPNHGPPKTDFVVKVIRGVHQQRRIHKFEGRGTVNPMSPLTLNASFAIQTSHFSSNHSFLVETIVSGEYDFEKLDLEVLELTSEALALTKTPEEFRKRYGDYFVLGSKNRYWFHALVECRYSITMIDETNHQVSYVLFSKIEWSRRCSNYRSLGRNSMAGSSRPPWTGRI